MPIKHVLKGERVAVTAHRHPSSIADLNQVALRVRRLIIRMLLKAGSGHSAGPLGMADVFTALYFAVLQHRPNQPQWDGRDRVILSNGHICPVLYATLAEAGYFPKKEVLTLRAFESRLQGHPHLGSLPGVENTSGPLGQGLSQAAGLALGLRIDNKKNRVYCLLSDGEHQEGQTWEAYMFAAANRLTNLTVLIDRNNIQIDGYTEDIMPLHPLEKKIESFGWQVFEVDGHNIQAVIDTVHQAHAIQEQPTAIICNTIPGKGVSFMENNYVWHGKPPHSDEAKRALRELRSLQGSIWWE
ncbi:transketolase [Candidatus Woesebacteria bacterium]|nr:transketolase [Candidatus Woesebacteria bacterium]